MSDFEHGYAEVNGLRLHYAAAGKGPLLLFLHGFPEFWYAWRHQLADLRDRFRAVAIDTRGVNLSSRPAEVAAYHLDHLAADPAALIGHFGFEKAMVIGHDWGGITAWWLAIKHPELLDRLVIVNAAHPGVFERLLRDEPRQQAASAYMQAFRSDRGEELLSRDDFGAFRQNILAPGRAAGHLSDADVDAYLAAWRQPGGLAGGLNYYRANRRHGPAEDGAPAPMPPAETRVEVPTLVIWGERDPYFVPENLDLMPDYVADLRIERFPDNDHWIVHQMPAEVSRLIGAFAAPK